MSRRFAGLNQNKAVRMKCLAHGLNTVYSEAQTSGPSISGLALYHREPMHSYNLAHDKTNIMACTPSEDSDQTEHKPSQIRILESLFVLNGTHKFFITLDCRFTYHV